MNSTARVYEPNTESDLVYELRARIRDLEKELGRSWLAPRSVRLTSTESQVLGVIIKRSPLCTKEAVYNVLYGDRSDPPTEQLVLVFVSKIRRKLKAFDVAVGTTYGRGYFITPDNLAKLNALYAPGERQPEETR